MNAEPAAADPAPDDVVASAPPPDGGEFLIAPSGGTGCLIRRVPADQGAFDFTTEQFKYQAFLPTKADGDGLSVNWEGSAPAFETAESLLPKARSPRVQQFGGVVAVPFQAVKDGGMRVIRNDVDDSLWHCLIPELSRKKYVGDDRNAILELADKLQRAANGERTRIKPKPTPT